jgi:hypothetical protein
MPKGTELDMAFKVMTWAYESAEAEGVDPEGVKAYRACVDQLGGDEPSWRAAYDMANRIWQKGYDLHLKKRDLF